MLLIPYQFSRVIIGNTICLVDTKILNLHSTIILYRINSCCGGLWVKRKCGVVRLSTERFWNTYVQINNTPHRIEYIENDICLYAVMSVALSLHN